MNFKQLTSDAQLGLRLLFIRPIQRLLQEPGPTRFAKNFFPEGLVPTTLAERDELAEAAKCIGCGLCDAVPGTGIRPSAIPAVFSKQSADLKVLGRELTLDAAALERLAAAEQLCPTAVPLRRVAVFLAARRTSVARAERAAAEVPPP